VFGARGSRHDAFALVLDSWIMAVQGLLEPPQCNELAEPIQAIRSDLEAVLREASRLRIAAGAAVEPALLDALVAGDVRGARRVIADLASTFPSPDHLIVEVVLPAMAEIGRRWELNELEIFQEHLATEAIRRLLAGLAATVPDTRQKPGAVALVSCAPGDEHELIPLALTSYLECRHWTVKNLGVGLPPDQLARAVAVLEPAVLFLTVTMLSRLDDALDAIESVQRESGRCRIIAGGRGAVLARAVLEDRKVLVALDFADGLRLAEERSLDA
jgi:methanogenic corrinoid protein MtbC1